MNATVTLTVCLLAALVCAAGCAGIGGGQPTPVPTTVAVTPVPTTEVPTTPAPVQTTASLRPGPTETLPTSMPVDINVEKGGTYSTTIFFKFNGGKGQSFVSKVDVRVTRPDGTVVTGNLIPQVGQEVVLEGTKGDDRAEVIVTMKTGSVYKVIDQLMPYKTRG
jgi:hypothetical protein